MRVFRRGVASAAILGLTVTLTGTAAAARPGAEPPGTEACAASQQAGAVQDVKQAEACAQQAGRPGAVPRTTKAVTADAQSAVRAEPQVCGPPYVNGDPRLGPKYLPRTGYFGFLLRGYDRYGRLSPSRFLYQYWDENALPTPGWRYPPDDGFVHQLRFINSRPAKRKVTLRLGQYVDRFGAETGRFLAPGGASFGSRALPPDSLNTRSDDPAHLCNYHLYRVIRPFPVDGGLAEPAFQQPGKGLQYVVAKAYLGNPPERVDVQWLVEHKYLERVY